MFLVFISILPLLLVFVCFGVNIALFLILMLILGLINNSTIPYSILNLPADWKRRGKPPHGTNQMRTESQLL